MYAIGLRHSRDADGAACIYGSTRAGTRPGTPGRTGCGESELIGNVSCARAGALVAVFGSGAGA